MNFSTLDRFFKTKIGIFREKLMFQAKYWPVTLYLSTDSAGVGFDASVQPHVSCQHVTPRKTSLANFTEIRLKICWVLEIWSTIIITLLEDSTVLDLCLLAICLASLKLFSWINILSKNYLWPVVQAEDLSAYWTGVGWEIFARVIVAGLDRFAWFSWGLGLGFDILVAGHLIFLQTGM